MDTTSASEGSAQPAGTGDFFVRPPTLSLPKGGGAIRGIGETVATDPANGTATVTVPITLSSGRAGFGPDLSLRYGSGSGNGPFGLGWTLGVADVVRRTDRGLPRYDGTDVFLLGGEELVPVPAGAGDALPVRVAGRDFTVRRYRPRTESGFALIEYWTELAHPEHTCWRTISQDNVTSWFGRDTAGRVADPADPGRVARWLLTETYDDRGNVIVYEYVADDTRDIDVTASAERTRPAGARTANRYLKTVRYGNRVPYRPTTAADAVAWPVPTEDSAQGWMFTAVLDYGDHRGTEPTPAPDTVWPGRTDPFSHYRFRFEVRTHRLCRRILMFHSFPEDLSVGADCLVASTDLEYQEPADPADPTEPGFTVLRQVTHRGYRHGASGVVTVRQHPPVTFGYQPATVDPVVRFAEGDILVNAPAGIEGDGYRFVDLDGEGLSGILADQAGAWYFMPNLGAGQFGAMRPVPRAPTAASAGSGRPHLADLTGAGLVELVALGGPDPGRHTREPDGTWSRFEPFRSYPNLDWDDPSVHLVDLTGDGRADVLTANGPTVTWYENLGGDGFSEARHAPADSADSDTGPRRILQDRHRTVFLADMSGDGLSDLVQVDARGVRYRPNLGHGAFGREITLFGGPLDRPDRFDPARVRLFDVDDTGPADLIYLGEGVARLYLNRSGNSLSEPLPLDLLAAGNHGVVRVVDLFGTGTACLVWNSTLPADAARPARYVDLMSAGKPHLLTTVDNNSGGTVEIGYTPSTRFAVADRLAGRPWLGPMPFPVHTVSRVTRRDRWRGTAFSSTFSYHHGCWDGVEREFRGFGRVEQVDTEDYGAFTAHNADSPYVTGDHRLFQPPVKTVTWYHPGPVAGCVEDAYAVEWFPARWPAADFREAPTRPVELPARLSPGERRAALRACGGRLLRQEAYELDPDGLAAGRHVPVRLFSVRSAAYTVARLQPATDESPAAFLVTAAESVTYQHDLALPMAGSTVRPDPRITHTLHLRHDTLGRPVQTVTVAYPRRATGVPAGLPAELAAHPLVARVHGATDVRYTEVRHTADVMVTETGTAGWRGAVRHRRLRLPWETRAYVLSGVPVPESGYYDRADLARYGWCEDGKYPPAHRPGEQPVAVTSLAFHQRPIAPGPHRRVTGRVRTRYFDDGDGVAQPTTALPFGQHGPRGLPYESYRLALTDGLLDAVFRTTDPATSTVEDRLAQRPVAGGPTALEMLTRGDAGGYVAGATLDSASVGEYWTRSGVAGFGADAAAGFYLPERYTDPFGAVTTIGYDARRMLVSMASDPTGVTTAVERFDLRVLAPAVLIDANGNRTATAYDALGRVTATATQGKPVGGGWQGDRLDGLDADPDPAAIAAFCTGPTQDDVQARAWLSDATVRVVHDHGGGRDAQGAPAWGLRMPATCTISRERHHGSLPPGQVSPIQVGRAYTDGSGGALLSTAQAEPDPDTGQDRWIVSGRTVVNNKGNPVMVYEPTFTSVFGPQLPPAAGVCTVTTYDAANRVIRTDHPDGTADRAEYGPWVTVSHDRNDTVLDSQWYQDRGNPDPAQPLPSTATADQRAAWLTARHAGTPGRTVLDPLGRDAVAIAHHRGPDDTGAWADDFRLTYTAREPDGSPLWTRDPRGNLVEQLVVPPKSDGDPDDNLPAGACPAHGLTGAELFRHGMDEGDRWSLPDTAGALMLVWDVNDGVDGSGAVVTERRMQWTRYDAVRRPTQTWLRIDAGPAALVQVSEYADPVGLPAAGLAAARAANLVGQQVQGYDPAGLSTVDKIGIDGEVEEGTRTAVGDVTAAVVVDWNRADRPALLAVDEAGVPETYREITEHDALGRPTTIYHWHRPVPGPPPAADRVAVSGFAYDRRGDLHTRTLWLRATLRTSPNGTRITTADPDPARTITVFAGVVRNARGQRLSHRAGAATTRCWYDPQTFRLTRQHTTRAGAPDVHDLNFTYDPVGNLTRLIDAAQDPAFHANAVTDGTSDYIYDASYRLIEATGRENQAAVGPPPHPEGPWPVAPVPGPATVRSYTQRYRYDDAGNMRRITHVTPGGGWTRNLEPVATGNRLARSWDGTAVWDATTPAFRVAYRHDRHGNLLNLAATEAATDIRWGWNDRIRSLDLQGGGACHYAYDGTGQRAVKRLLRLGGEETDRIYLDGFERYRRRVGGKVVEDVETLHVMDGTQRLLQLDDILVASTARSRTLPRFQYGNHLGSVTVELDAAGMVITREEFHPYGTIAFRLQHADAEVPAKRYRFTGMERDEETGLNYHGARYYAAWLARWISADPVRGQDTLNRYAFVRCNPIRYVDPGGKREATPEELARMAQLSELENASRVDYEKLWWISKGWNRLFWWSGALGRIRTAKTNRRQLAEAIGRAQEGEVVLAGGTGAEYYFREGKPVEILPTLPNYMTAGEARALHLQAVMAAAAFSPISPIAQGLASLAGASEETKREAVLLGGGMWDVAASGAPLLQAKLSLGRFDNTRHDSAGTRPAVTIQSKIEYATEFHVPGASAAILNGRLHLAMETKAGGTASGKTLFFEILNSMGPGVKEVAANWGRGMPGNLDQFNLGLRLGLSLEEAARQTFTGRMATRYGFLGPVTLVEPPVGEYGNYDKVRLLFPKGNPLGDVPLYLGPPLKDPTKP
ncbi:SpvB/TcaC N-terminal domain-containing protein [Streptomyces chartreusis]